MDEDSEPENLSGFHGFGFEVKEVRLGRKLTQKHLALGVGYSEAYVSKVESGQLIPSEKFARGCDHVFGTHGVFERLRRRLEESDHPSWFVPYVQLEQRATRVLDFSSSVVMGLLQTESYARAIFRTAHPWADDDVLTNKVAARMRRRAVLEAPVGPSVWCILHEACLRTAVGGPEVLAEQLAHLLTAVTSWRVTLQVLPFSAGAPAGNVMPLTLMTFSDTRPLLYSEGAQGGRLYDAAPAVDRAMDDYDRLRAHALSPDASLAFIKSLLEESE
ncbi:helix-turn-helix transcriptional regulator [Streptomyces sp. DSM 44917]|uniref:Helix-turn-helix transcriptional regulator n=1 Tax=Streptomyces boetiae TaxID=3075541 RepID=A0ABU2LDQ2_9ACTN|nr:helix-turn-helix transcriptional regulator [Streptomyces sp. DSM 44917]MDT0309714.1 helix-turn-helix transcriptional regulator [Streptomyces sp. DSM 44917]